MTATMEATAVRARDTEVKAVEVAAMDGVVAEAINESA